MMKEKEEKEEREEKEKEEEGGCKYSGGRTPALNQRPSVTGLPCKQRSNTWPLQRLFKSCLVLRMMSCSKEGRRLLFAFLAALLQFAPSELTMFAAEQKDGNVIVTLNLFISSGTRQAFIFLPPPTNGSC